MSEIDPMNKAAECERATAVVSDPLSVNLVGKNLRDLWIELADARPLLSEADFTSAPETLKGNELVQAQEQKPVMAQLFDRMCRINIHSVDRNLRRHILHP